VTASLARLPAFLALFFAAWTGRVLLIPWTDAALWWLVRIEKIDPRAAFDQRPGLRPWLGGLLAGAYIAGGRAYEAWTGIGWHAIPAAPVPVVAAAFVGIAFAALCEEFVFRGLILKALAARTGFWRANIGQAALYAAIQLPAWAMLIEFDAAGFAFLALGAFVSAALLGGLVRLTGTIWAGFAVQALGNALQGLGLN
jgi:membrane protease YdiL (CAAX protease family)